MAVGIELFPSKAPAAPNHTGFPVSAPENAVSADCRSLLCGVRRRHGAVLLHAGGRQYRSRGMYEKCATSTAEDFDANGTKMGFKYFFAPKVGMVKQELDIQGQKATIELEKFEPGK